MSSYRGLGLKAGVLTDFGFAAGFTQSGWLGSSLRARKVNTEPTSKLFDNQVLSIEMSLNFSRESMTNATNGTRNGPCFTVGAYLHRRGFTLDS